MALTTIVEIVDYYVLLHRYSFVFSEEETSGVIPLVIIIANTQKKLQ